MSCFCFWKDFSLQARRQEGCTLWQTCKRVNNYRRIFNFFTHTNTFSYSCACSTVKIQLYSITFTSSYTPPSLDDVNYITFQIHFNNIRGTNRYVAKKKKIRCLYLKHLYKVNICLIKCVITKTAYYFL